MLLPTQCTPTLPSGDENAWLWGVVGVGSDVGVVGAGCVTGGREVVTEAVMGATVEGGIAAAGTLTARVTGSAVVTGVDGCVGFGVVGRGALDATVATGTATVKAGAGVPPTAVDTVGGIVTTEAAPEALVGAGLAAPDAAEVAAGAVAVWAGSLPEATSLRVGDGTDFRVDTVLTGTVLTGTVLTGTVLTGTVFAGTVLTGTVLVVDAPVVVDTTLVVDATFVVGGGDATLAFRGAGTVLTAIAVDAIAADVGAMSFAVAVAVVEVSTFMVRAVEISTGTVAALDWATTKSSS
jgi:Pentapeptide repeats (8 copies)